MGDGGVVGAHAFRGLGFNVYLLDSDIQQLGNIVADGPGVGHDFWFGEDQRAVDVADHIAGIGDALHGLLKKHGRVGAFPLRIAGREVGADVTGSDGSEQGVGNGVQQDVAVGVAGEAAVMRQGDAADFERNAGRELV